MKNKENYNSIIINILFLVFPLSIIFGNFFINLNIVLLCIAAFVFYHKEMIRFKINFLDKIVIIFFFYTLIVLSVNFFDSFLNEITFSKNVILKTFFYLRYFILYFVLRVLVHQKILRLDYFLLACACCAFFVCFDILFQFVVGKNIIGMVPSSDRHFTGVFGDEYIAGGYLQKFALFTFFLPFVLKKNFFHKSSIQIALFILFVFGIILSGNRMPFFLFIFSFLTFSIIQKEIRKYFLSILILILLFSSLNYNLNQNFKLRIDSFYNHGKLAVNSFFIKDILNHPQKKEILAKPYVSEFFCARLAIKKNPIFGGGIRSYRTFRSGCNTHPHNYYFEILAELGIVGFSIILILLFSLFRKIFIKNVTPLKFSLNHLDDRAIPFFLILFIEFFPLRTSGSFFATNNASVIFIILAILVSIISKKKLFDY
jgi:O-antigen ligase